MKKTYRQIAGDLKRLGLVNYDLRRELSSGQKAQITKLAQTWGHYIKHPELFHAARVSGSTARELKKAGFKVTPRGMAVVPLYEHKTARIDGKRGEIIYGEPGQIRERTKIVDHKNFLPQLKSLVESKTKLPRNAMISIRVGDRARWGRRFSSWHELTKYLDQWEPNDPGETKENVIALMSIVEVPIAKQEKTRAKKKAPAAKKRRN